MEYYVGLDVSLRSVAICVIDKDGRTVLERSVACEIPDIAQALKGLPKPVLCIGFEAGAMSRYLFFGLGSLSIKTVDSRGTLRACCIAAHLCRYTEHLGGER